METIQKIEEASFVVGERNGFDGFIITTDRQQIKIGISDYSRCCESWGHFASLDNFDDFIGADLYGIKLVDSVLNVSKMEEYKFYEACFMFVNLETSKGTLQFTAYNDHNGYYSHEAVVISEQLDHSEYL